MSPWSEKDHKLTGRWRVRRGDESAGFFKIEPVLIAQVEETFTYYPVMGPDDQAKKKVHWRDMRETDLAFILDRSFAGTPHALYPVPKDTFG